MNKRFDHIKSRVFERYALTLTDEDCLEWERKFAAQETLRMRVGPEGETHAVPWLGQFIQTVFSPYGGLITALPPDSNTKKSRKAHSKATRGKQKRRRNLNRGALILIAALSLNACASGPPLIDPQASKTPDKIWEDYATCQQIVASKHSPAASAFWKGLVGTIGGALVAFAVFRYGGTPTTTQAYAIGSGAITGGLLGGAGGYMMESSTETRLIRSCLTGRGYSIIE